MYPGRNRLIGVLIFTLLTPFLSQASDRYRVLLDEFDARGMSQDEKRFLQAALAFQGYYNGLQDGKWGRGSQASIENYSMERHSVEPLNIHSATLAFDFFSEIEASGWRIKNLKRFGISFAFPSKILSPIKNTHRLSLWQDGEKGVELAVWSTEPRELKHSAENLNRGIRNWFGL